ncbi:MAG TPA: hypothetical protein DEF36_13175 [Desulfotomaculum sp.]|nr:hypothetical protein [Desulfotomaculum sp.]
MHPQSLTSADVMQLQRSIGNRAVSRFLKGKGIASENHEPVQKKVQAAGEESLTGRSQAKLIDPAEENIQMKRENNTGLPDSLKNGVENLSGINMSNVRVHYNSSKPAQVGALAYTQGTDIHVAQGQEKHLPHEAWHVVQQAQGRVRPTLRLNGAAINDEAMLENEADKLGTAAKKETDHTRQLKKNPILAKSEGDTLQLAKDVCSKAYFTKPVDYLKETFPDTNISENAGSGGILDEPMKRLVLALKKYKAGVLKGLENEIVRLSEIKNRNKEDEEKFQVIAPWYKQIDDNVNDLDSAYTWVKQHTLQISKYLPNILTIKHQKVSQDKDTHTFHFDRGYVKLTDKELTDQEINSKPERASRLRVVNGPWDRGWVRGHSSISRKEHRFIEHVHVDKDTSDGIDIYNTDNKNDLTTVSSHNINDRSNFSVQNDGKQEEAIKGAESKAHDEAYVEYKKLADK